MDFKAYQNRLSQLSARFNLMVMLVFGLLITNLVLGGLVWYATVNQRIEITPFFSGSSYQASRSGVDAEYLSQMSENFVNARLNVTPETVTSNHQRVLAFVESGAYPLMKKTLDGEARVIAQQKISSVFAIKGVTPNPAELSVKVSGVLRRFVGIRALKEERLTYTLNYRQHLGRLSLIRFTYTQEKSHE